MEITRAQDAAVQNGRLWVTDMWLQRLQAQPVINTSMPRLYASNATYADETGPS